MLLNRNIKKSVSKLITQVEVDSKDKDLDHQTKIKNEIEGKTGTIVEL